MGLNKNGLTIKIENVKKNIFIPHLGWPYEASVHDDFGDLKKDKWL